tara:strand:+ start:5669 stop:6328 length:660 start_codon:yes stop_codon:yes gene_type:complete
LKNNNKKLHLINLTNIDYNYAWDKQKKAVENRKLGLIPDTLFFVEHEPVYTLGKNSNHNHLLDSRDLKIPIFNIERGGDVTFHGPGQLVGYPILDLHYHKLSISWYMRTLEKVIIETLKEFKIEAHRRHSFTGVWVNDFKVAALGVKLSKWVSMHGFSLNINNNLKFYDGIIPCGLFQYDVTSMKSLLKKEVDINKVKEIITKKFVKNFSFEKVKFSNE